MGQGVGGVSEAPAVGAAEGREPIGRYLAQQRKLRGIELDELAARTRIPRRSLERLEAGAFDHSPDGFSRGFVRTVAEAIGLDPDEAVARMLPEPDPVAQGGPRWGRVAGALGALAALVLGALFAADRALAPAAEAPAGGARELRVRRDYVRELANARGIDASNLQASDAVIALAPAPLAEPPVETEIASEAAPAATPAQSPPVQLPALPTPAPAASAPVASASKPTPPPAPPASTPRAETAAPPPAPEPAPLAAQESTEPDASVSDEPVSEPPPLPADSAEPPPESDAEARD